MASSGPVTALVAAYRTKGRSFHALSIPNTGSLSLDLSGLVPNGPVVATDMLALVLTAGRALRAADDLTVVPEISPASVPTPSKKPSKPLSRTAMVRQARAEARAEAIPPAAPSLAPAPVLPDDVTAAIKGFAPHKLDPQQWEKVAEATSALATAYRPPNARWVTTQMGVLARFAVWVAARPGRDEPDAPLTAIETIEDGLVETYLAGPLADAPEASRATARSLLRRAVRNLSGAPAPERLSAAPLQPPYSAYECADFVRKARVQPTAAKRRSLGAVVALGLGAGLDSNDQRLITPERIHEIELGDGVIGLAVVVPGARARTVVVRAEYEALLREVLELHAEAGRHADQPLYGERVERVNAASNVLKSAVTALGPGVDVSVARLRSTWLVAVMSAPVPLGAVLAAAGLRSARSLAELVAYCPAPDPVVVARILREVSIDSVDPNGGAK